MQETWVRSLMQEDPHASEHLRPCATTTEACAPKAYGLQQEKPLHWEACVPQLEHSVCSLKL